MTGNEPPDTARMSGQEILGFLADRIRLVYVRPTMYGADARGAYLLLKIYHDLYAKILQREWDYFEAFSEATSAAGCEPRPIEQSVDVLRQQGRDATEDDLVGFVVGLWKQIDAKLGWEFPPPGG